MKFLYDILKGSGETAAQLRQEGIRPKEKYGFYFVPLYPLLERDGELINLWNSRHYDWTAPPVEEELVIELPDDEFIEFYVEDFAFRHIDVTFAVRDIEMIVNDIYDYGKKHLPGQHSRIAPLWNGEANVRDWFGNDLLLHHTFRGTDSFIFQLGMLCSLCRYNSVLGSGPGSTGKKTRTNPKKTYDKRFVKIMHRLQMRESDPFAEDDMLNQLYSMKERVALSSCERKNCSLHAELGKRHSRLTFHGYKQESEKMIMLSSWDLASSYIGISVDMSLYRQIRSSVNNSTLNALWERLRIPEQLPGWALEPNYEHNFFLVSAMEKKAEDDEYLDMCSEILDILSKLS